MSRKFYIIAKAESKIQLEQCNRTVEQLEKYGVDTGDESLFTFTFSGDVTVDNLIFEQCKCVLRTLYNGMIDIVEVGENIEGYSFVIYEKVPKRTSGLSEIFDAMEDWVTISPDCILEEYLVNEDGEPEEEEDEDEEAEDDVENDV